MLISFNSISIFSYLETLIKYIALSSFALLISCEEANYELDNPSDPANMDLDPPALFFHPPEINAAINDTISVELYGLELNPAAAAQLSIRYEYEALEVDYVEAGPFFTGDNFPIEIVDEPSDGTLDIFIYYLPDMNADQSEGGTWSIATVHFITKQIRGSALEWVQDSTRLRDENNLPVNIKDFGDGWVNVE